MVLIKLLHKNKFEVTALDIFNGFYYTPDDRVKSILPSIFSGFLKKVALRCFRKQLLKRFVRKSDVVDIQFVDSNYSRLINQLPDNLICTLFGSDLFRTSEKEKKDQSLLFEKAKKIVLSNNMVPYFNDHFVVENSKFFFTQYGSSKLSKIKSLKTDERINATKTKRNIPLNKIVISCGYNSKEAQQHRLLINELTKLDSTMKDSIYLIFPMTYGEYSIGYQEAIKEHLDLSEIEYLMLTDHLSEDDYIDYKIISDITINTQTTDALASSIKEAFVGGEVVLLAEWLPYDIYENIGLYYKKINFSNLATILSDSINAFESEKLKAKNNAEIIYNFSAWEIIIHQWITLYSSFKYGSK
jgi:hypothetical protein